MTTLQGHPVENPARGPAGLAAAAAFRALSRLRGGRIFHPDGLAYSGTLAMHHVHRYGGVPLLERPSEYPVVCRLSRGGGLPEPIRDVLGLAVRILDAHGPDRHQDFLLATGASARIARNLLLPGVGGFFGQTFSSLLPYRVGGQLRMVGARSAVASSHRRRGSLNEVREADARRELRFRLMFAPLSGDWAPFAELELDRRLPDSETEHLAFTPWNTGGGIRPAGPLQRLRRAAYRGSQHGRGVLAP